MEQRTEAWHKMRSEKIGASDSATILGLSPWKNTYQLYREKMGLEKTYTNKSMERGIELEEKALRLFEIETDYLMSPKVMVSPRNEWQMASLDGFEIDGKAAVEIKCMKIENHEKALTGYIPDYYFSQVQHQIEVTGLDKIFYCSYHPDHVKPLYIQEIYRDDEFIANMVKKEHEFYLDHLKPRISPLNPKIEPKKIESDIWKKLSDEYLRLDRSEKEASKRKDEIKDLLLELSGAENAKGNGILLQKIERKGIIPYGNIPMIKTMDLESFRKPSTSFWQVKESNE